jgi:hypothetical protein
MSESFERIVDYLDATRPTELPLLSNSEINPLSPGSVRTRARQGLGPIPLCAWRCLL